MQRVYCPKCGEPFMGVGTDWKHKTPLCRHCSSHPNRPRWLAVLCRMIRRRRLAWQ